MRDERAGVSEKSAVEVVTGNVATKATTTAIAVVGATITPLAAFVPFLVDALASGRQARRLQQMFDELTAITNRHSAQLASLTDDQYKVVSEAISAAFYTVSAEKLELLKRAAASAMLDSAAVDGVSDALARLVRDISAAEAAFVIRNFQFELVVISAEDVVGEGLPSSVTIRPGTPDESILSGLINLGLLYPKQSRWDLIAYEWSPLTAKLIHVFQDRA